MSSLQYRLIPPVVHRTGTCTLHHEQVEVRDDLGWTIARGSIPADELRLYLTEPRGLLAAEEVFPGGRSASAATITCPLRSSRELYGRGGGRVRFELRITRLYDDVAENNRDHRSTDQPLRGQDGTNRRSSTGTAGNTDGEGWGVDDAALPATARPAALAERVDLADFDVSSLDSASDECGSGGMVDLLLPQGVGSPSSSSSSLSSLPSPPSTSLSIMPRPLILEPSENSCESNPVDMQQVLRGNNISSIIASVPKEDRKTSEATKVDAAPARVEDDPELDTTAGSEASSATVANSIASGGASERQGKIIRR